MKRALAYSVSALALTWAVSADAASPNIKGSYAFTGEAACLVAPGNTNPNEAPPQTDEAC